MGIHQIIVNFFLFKNHSNQRINNGIVNGNPNPQISHTYLYYHLI